MSFDYRMVSPLLLAAFAFSVATPQGVAQDGNEFFESKVRPILVNRCSQCHGDKMQMAGLKLTTAAGVEKGADTGAIILKGDPEHSRLIRAIQYGGKIKMPPAGKLPDTEIAALTEWVRMGAPWPRSDDAVGGDKAVAKEARPELWSLKPVKDSPPPEVKDAAWVESPIDRFILAKLEENHISPASPAGKLTLLRRAKFDLHGLPPTPEEIEKFLADNRPEAFRDLVDRLLASPHYGEKWGRNWLDVARYADSTGVDEDKVLPYAWRYRDYVIDAFNRDLPYDQFIREQIAGDLLPAGKPGEVNVRGIVATGFLAVGPRPVAQVDKVREFYDVIDEQIDTTSKAFLGLTLACARCHDHKFDPLTTRDYYSMASIFASTKQFEDIKPVVSVMYFPPLTPEPEYRAYKSVQDKIRGKQNAVEIVLDWEAARFVARTRTPQMASYMLAARRVYHDREDPAGLATAGRLDPGILKKWVDYLKPSSEYRPYLDEWYKAGDADVRKIAEAYRQRFERTGAEWVQELAAAREKAGDALDDDGMPAGKPVFEGSKDRVFEEVAFKTGAFAVAAKERETLLGPESAAQVKALRAEIGLLKKSSPPQPPMACGVAEGEPVEQHVFLRGVHENPGDVVPKQFPVVLAGANQKPITHGSGRRELAEWLSSRSNPLTSRVMVNRIWAGHFGAGLVTSANNFGATGDKPSHPELLDYLAARFVAGGWSVKAMHRLIMLSSAYRMGSEITDAAWEKDPADRLLSRFPQRRLTVEEMRDAMLAIDGSLDPAMGGDTVDKKAAPNAAEACYGCKDAADDASRRRTIYLPVYRNRLLKILPLFDFVDATTSAGRREETNVAPQALFLMNSEFVAARSAALAGALLAGFPDDAARLRRAYLLVVNRPPSQEESERALAYVRNFPASDSKGAGREQRAWKSLCHVLLSANDFHFVD